MRSKIPQEQRSTAELSRKSPSHYGRLFERLFNSAQCVPAYPCVAVKKEKNIATGAFGSEIHLGGAARPEAVDHAASSLRGHGDRFVRAPAVNHQNFVRCPVGPDGFSSVG